MSTGLIDTPTEGSTGTHDRRSLPRRIVRGPETDPRWARPALLALLVLTAVLYLWDLSAEGNANSFYAAAVQSGSESWKAWFFGSLDPSNFITVDKPPASLWVMGLSARIFGYSTWSMLVPEALEGVAAVALLAAAVRRVAGSTAGLVAGAAMALTPAAVLIFRFNNPDALLVLLLVAAAYCTTRAIESGSGRWLAGAGVAVGFAFLAKSGEALLPVPALGLAYLVAAPVSWRRRVAHLAGALGALVVSAGWYILVVALWPASSRPFIGGSTDNSALELAFGYNGLGRLFGGSGNGGGGGRGGGGGTGTSFGGSTGLGRMFRGEFGLEASWLIPAAAVLLAAGLWLTLRAPRTDRRRAALILWGVSGLVTLLTFSFMKGTIHPYYTVALAAPIAGVIGVGGSVLWQRRDLVGRAVLALAVVLSAIWGVHLLRSYSGYGAAEAAVIVVSVLAVVALVGSVLRPSMRRALTVAAGLTVLAVAVPTGAWAVETAGTVHTGSIPTAVSGGTDNGGFGGAGGFGGRRFGGTRPGGTGASSSDTTRTRPAGSFGGGMGGESTSAALVKALKATTTRWSAATVGSSSAAVLELAGGKAVMAIGGFTGSDPAPTLAQFEAYVKAGDITYFIAGGGMGGGTGGATTTGAGTGTRSQTDGGGGFGNGGFGGSGGRTGGSTTKTTGSTGSEGMGEMPGQSGSTGAPEGGAPMGAGEGGFGDRSGAGNRGGFGRGGTTETSSQITSWVEAHFTKKTIGGETVYDLTSPTS